MSEESIGRARDALAPLLLQLKTAQHLAGVSVSETTCSPPVEHGGLEMWDDLINEVVQANADVGHADVGHVAMPRPRDPPSGDAIDTPGRIEEQLIPLPSNGTVDHAHTKLELSHWIARAEHHLTRIRDLIADKSFQYSHVIRVAPRKGVTTRSRSSVKKLNMEIAGQSRMYSQCRARLATLGADAATLARLQPLAPEHVKASTAIIDPNNPGSTQLKLSWIWQTAGGHRFGLTMGSSTDTSGRIIRNDPDSMIECESIPLPFIMKVTVHSAVRRVHWLRARAQLMRWQEEVTLISYEMQWTVRYFLYKSREWAVRLPALAQTVSPTIGPDPTLGAVAYIRCKQAMWHDLAEKGNKIFTAVNNAYISPF